jgi:hypothetical protein
MATRSAFSILLPEPKAEPVSGTVWPAGGKSGRGAAPERSRVCHPLLTDRIMSL